MSEYNPDFWKNHVGYTLPFQATPKKGQVVKTFIWEYVDGVTNRYHDGGGVVIVTSRDYSDVWSEYVADTRKAYLEEFLEFDDEDGAIVSSLPEPDITFSCDADNERVIVFPDSGCC